MNAGVIQLGQPKCACCKDRGTVPDIDGNLRPCSRCRTAAFDAWANARRGRPQPAPPTADTGKDIA